MPRKRDLILTNLAGKGFEQIGGDHIFLVYYRKDGQKTAIRTKISRGSSHRDVSDVLLGQMARQLRLPKIAFLQLVDCSMDQSGYEAFVKP